MHHGHDALDWATGIGQVVAVIIAVAVAYFAARSARAAERTAQAQARPLLIDVPYGEPYENEKPIVLPNGESRRITTRGEILANAEEVWLSVPFRNVGTGVAVIVKTIFAYHPSSDTDGGFAMTNHYYPPPDSEGSPLLVAVPPGEEIRLGFEGPNFQTSQDALAERRDLSVTITYTDLGGEQATDLRAALGARSDSTSWQVKAIASEPAQPS